LKRVEEQFFENNGSCGPSSADHVEKRWGLQIREQDFSMRKRENRELREGIRGNKKEAISGVEGFA